VNLLFIAALLFWEALRHRNAVRAVLSGVDPGVVGLLLAALYNPVWTSAIFGPADFALGITAFLLLVRWRCRPGLPRGK
jgi:chromate transporter